uniref:Uncharacterized protein n=1 Tax=Anguilla anguilla TaxID=7936 RepID=A0A0E9WEW2_ANGAN
MGPYELNVRVRIGVKCRLIRVYLFSVLCYRYRLPVSLRCIL